MLFRSVVDVGDDGVQFVQVVVEAGSAIVAVLVLVVEAELEVGIGAGPWLQPFLTQHICSISCVNCMVLGC